jgi:hypothetical protein
MIHTSTIQKRLPPKREGTEKGRFLPFLVASPKGRESLNVEIND